LAQAVPGINGILSEDAIAAEGACPGALAKRSPALSIWPVTADFMRPLALPPSVGNLPRLAHFAGSTIANMTVRMAIDFFRAIARTLGEDALLLIGIDRIKDRKRLIAAYDHAQGVTTELVADRGMDRRRRALRAAARVVRQAVHATAVAAPDLANENCDSETVLVTYPHIAARYICKNDHP
jgi:hypothetical protein